MWLVFVASSLLILICIESGYRWGRQQKRKQGDDKPGTSGSIATMVQIQLGLVAFLVAFTFGFATQRFSERRHLVIAEANSIGTTYLRAGLLPSPRAETVQDILRKYVDLRLKLRKDITLTHDYSLTDKALIESNKLQGLLWKHVKENKEVQDTPSAALFEATVNETIDLQSERLYAERYGKLPDIVWVVLYGLTFLGMVGVGYQFGNRGTRNWLAVLLAAISFSAVLTMIADIDRPIEGFMMVTQRPLVDLAKQIGEPSDTPGPQ